MIMTAGIALIRLGSRPFGKRRKQQLVFNRFMVIVGVLHLCNGAYGLHASIITSAQGVELNVSTLSRLLSYGLADSVVVDYGRLISQPLS